ncbi:MAG TPA: ATPase, T2SS/T4P/T4SS family [Candidatus Saccharimonadales bacterium]|nr:ATPase, T2SS/T4P/T4SS family [Candidatus Saccharimonadales bacterium]
MKRKKLGELLRDRGQISAANLQKLFIEQETKMVRLGELILESGLVDKPSLIKALEDVSLVPYVDCGSIRSDREVMQLIPESMAMRLDVLPIRMDQTRLVVAMAEPQNLTTIDEVRFSSGKDLSLRFGFRAEIQKAIARNYTPQEKDLNHKQALPGVIDEPTGDEQTVQFISTSSRQANRDAIQEIQAEHNKRKTPAVRLVSEIIQRAIFKHASDIHVEPQATCTTIRIRVDGVLRELETVPLSIQNSLISRLKILSDMDIGERRAPQDGRFMVSIGKTRVDMRVSTLPTQYGEKVVIRLLEATAPISGFNELGLPPNLAARLLQSLAQPQGMLLITGPTGSGKSTTIYSALNLLRKPAVNVVTVEDPIEYALPGVNQVQVNARAGLTFAGCLRSILRQDPNVIMIGEIRDLETAEIAMKAAQTGHLVLSTLHTNDSISAVARLLDLGIPEYLIASSVSAILAQRLVRKLCSCHGYKDVTPAYAERLKAAGWANPPANIVWPKGCSLCDYTGYKGRIGIYELMTIDEPIRAILRGSYKPDQVRDAARAAGMRRMQEDALEKLQAGVTTLDEIIRVVPMDVQSDGVFEHCGQKLSALFRFCPYCGIARELEELNSSASSLEVGEGVLN